MRASYGVVVALELLFCLSQDGDSDEGGRRYHSFLLKELQSGLAAVLEVKRTYLLRESVDFFVTRHSKCFGRLPDDVIPLSQEHNNNTYYSDDMQCKTLYI